MSRKVLGLCLLAGLGVVEGACAPVHKAVTARRTRCNYNAIQISEEKYEGGLETWTAVCGKHKFHCSSRAEGNRVIYKCREVREPVQQAQPTSTPDQPAVTPTPEQPAVAPTPDQPAVTPTPDQPAVTPTPDQPATTPTPDQ